LIPLTIFPLWLWSLASIQHKLIQFLDLLNQQQQIKKAEEKKTDEPAPPTGGSSDCRQRA
jgi:hypothetical protein